MSENKPQENPLQDGFAKNEAKAGTEVAQMNRFFGGLSGKAKRRLRLAQRRVTGKKETTAEMIARVAKNLE